MSHKQHQAAKLAQNKSAFTHSQTPPVDIFLNLLYNYNKSLRAAAHIIMEIV